MKKEAAVTENMLVALVGIVITTALLTIVICTFAGISDKWNMKQQARETLLVMETEGYLKPDEQSRLLSGLEQCGLNNITLDGTTQREVGYGSDITLSIKGTYQNKRLAFMGGLSKITNLGSEVAINLRSTAKQ